ncbi:MAG: ABC transporter ATP-binding protein [Candidatus Kapaibacterium sp.]|nr:MAG: ABC transporter ATP-binding protein [Candidatus Kapabacteria bacterium]
MNHHASPFVSLQNLSKSYREGEVTRTVLNNATLTIQKAETIALLGKSGSGKSTLLNLLSGIDTPDRGEVCINGRSIHQLSEEARTLFRREHIGFVFQFFNLIPTLTVEENILLPLELNKRTSPADRTNACSLLERVGMESRLSAFPDKLSGGEQQRVAVVRALVHKPLLLLADEPTGNLDTENGARVLALLLELCREQSTTLLMATHSLEAASKLGRVIVVQEGNIVEQEHF